MNDEDPAKAFFPDQDEPDLYGSLNVSEEASLDEIKKSYRKLALQYHPDKASNSNKASAATEEEHDKEAINKRFHQISFAYAVLSDEKRRKRFDETGRTDESFFEGEADWNAYFKELWQGEVNGKTLDDFVKSYKGSDEEKADILAAYTDSKGSLDALFENVMCSNVLDDEERFISIIEQAIKTKSVPTFTRWKKEVKDTRGRSKRKDAAKSEAKEAEELAKELGVHDKLFGGAASSGKDDAAATADSDKSGKKGKKSNGKTKANKTNVDEEGVDEDALRALIQSRNSKQNSMNSLIEKLEAKYGAADGDPFDRKPSKGSSKKRGKKKEEEETSRNQEPTEEEFEALQKKLFGDKKSEESDRADGPKAKKAKKSKKA